MEIINETIFNTSLEFIAPVYSCDYLKTAIDAVLTFTINIDLFLEMLLHRIRAKTMKFASSLKKSRNIHEQNLTKKISEIERNKTCETERNENETEKYNTLENLKRELILIRESNIKGQVIHSRAQWLQAGEKPTQYFCNLEHKTYVDKIIRKITKENSETITDQKDILINVKDYYNNL